MIKKIKGMCKVLNCFLNNRKNILESFLKITMLIMFFLFFKATIINSIEKTLYVDFLFKERFGEAVLFFVLIFINVFTFNKVFYHKYIPSKLQYEISILVLLFMGYFYIYQDELDFVYYKSFLFNLPYVFLFLFPLLLFIVGTLVIQLIDFFSKGDAINNEFLDDSPIDKIWEDSLNYSVIVKKMSHLLIREKYRRSMTIGLVGPWGNGKSSVISMLKKELTSHTFKRKNKKRITEDYIIIEFAPYLNHNEKDIISNFFESLSSSLVNYHGKLSSKIIEYSKKINDLYQNKNVIGFLESKVDSNNIPAKELYEDINSILSKIKKKIIVFIDDLDRLNDKEILEVLKLIRNTANFRNTTFVVAMDKAYVISRLKSEKQVLNSSFVDKFFQLEIYLPRIDKQILSEYFTNKLYAAKVLEEQKYSLEKIGEVINDSRSLFFDYNENIRDVKRLVNQIVYDYEVMGKNIDLIDFINFTLFKLKYPNVLLQLQKNPKSFFLTDKESGFYRLMTDKDENSKDLTRSMKEVNPIDIKEFDNYPFLSKVIDFNEECFISELKSENLYLLLKTLVNLFGNEEPSSLESIQYHDNFGMLIEQRTYKNFLSSDEFDAIIKIDKVDEQIKEIKKLNFNNKIEHFLKKVKYYEVFDEVKSKNIIDLLIILIEEKSVQNPSIIYVCFEKIIELIYDFSKKEDIDIVNWSRENIFHTNTRLNIRNRASLLKTLYFNRADSFFKDENDFFKEKSEELLKLFLHEKGQDLWKLNDYSFYDVYNDLKEIDIDIKALHKIILSFWEKNNPSLLFAQSISFDGFSSLAYKPSKVLISFFEDKNVFINFFKNHKYKDDIKEINNFLKLIDRTNFERYIKFNFNNITLIKERITLQKDYLLSKGLSDRYKNDIQIILEVSGESLSNYLWLQNRVVNNTSYYQRYSKSDNKNKIYLHYNRIIKKDQEKTLKNVFDILINSFSLDSKNRFNEIKLKENIKYNEGENIIEWREERITIFSIV